jgi:hypothetical protein
VQVLYDKVCDLREKRLDEDDALAEVGKVMEGLRRDVEALTKKGRLVDISLAAINQDILEFQKEKQAHLNQIPTIVTLTLHQVSYISCRTGYAAGNCKKVVADLPAMRRLRIAATSGIQSALCIVAGAAYKSNNPIHMLIQTA